jgi:hypothetical protein
MLLALFSCVYFYWFRFRCSEGSRLDEKEGEACAKASDKTEGVEDGRHGISGQLNKTKSPNHLGIN